MCKSLSLNSMTPLLAMLCFYGWNGTASAQNGNFEGWGLGVAAAVEFFDEPYVKTATLQGPSRRVVIEEATKSQPSIWAMGNWTLDECPFGLPCNWVKPGLFFGVKLAGEDGVGLEGLGVGFQLAFIQNNAQLRSGGTGQKASWNIGVGWVNHKMRRLAHGIEEDQPLPTDFEDIRYRHSSDSGWMVVITKNIF